MKQSAIAGAVLLALFTVSCNDGVRRQQQRIFPKEREKSEADTIIFHDERRPAVTDTVSLGDLNNDGIRDFAFIYTPPTIVSADQYGKIHFWNNCADGNCYNTITFSAELPALEHRMSVWGRLENAGDLDNDGFAELLFLPGWFTSNWTNLYLYSLKDGRWKKIADVSVRRDEIIDSMRKQLIRRNNHCYLKGIRFLDADDMAYFVKVPLELPKQDSVVNAVDSIWQEFQEVL
ncbi:MAG TPA: VCBS repeat-containing protein [Fluviicola sp.]|nr:VCBS repeat-containing protein [Fluviicola sp.]